VIAGEDVVDGESDKRSLSKERSDFGLEVVMEEWSGGASDASVDH
jgi:hypothetical protein